MAEYNRIFADVTFDSLMKRMLDRVPDYLDKREGSIIWDALAPAALELEIIYIEMDYILKNSFGDTADREFLIMRALERGIRPKSASQAIIKATFNMEIPINSRFSLGSVNYKVIDKLDGLQYSLICEEPGTVGNVSSGRLVPIEHMSGLNQSEVVELITPGEDEEDTESFRERYFQELKRNDYGGNIEDYTRKCMSIPGVGAVKVIPIWDGGGTVKLIFLDSEYKSPSVEMINELQTEIDPITNSGEGVGVAPIGHTVTVVGAEAVDVNINLQMTFKDGFSFASLEQNIKTVLDDYLLELRKAWMNSESTIIRITQLEARILDIDGVVDITSTTLNGAASNLTLEGNQIPMAGVITNV